MKKIALILAASLMSMTVFAQSKPAQKVPKEISCAVMKGNKVNIADATKRKMFADYKGNRYFFCCGSCPPAFKKDPAKYAKAPHIKTPAKKK
jgi:YHS domain-containing protein